MMKKILFLSYLGIAVLIYFQKQHIISWLKNSDTTQILPVIMIGTLLALIPIVPFGIIGGIIGAKFGAAAGSMISTLSSSLAAVLMFLLFRYFFAERGRQLINRYRKLDRFTIFMEQNAFITVFTARIIPIIPSPVINIYCALSNMRLVSFIAATAIGKMPVMLVFALAGDQMFNNPHNIIVTWILKYF